MKLITIEGIYCNLTIPIGHILSLKHKKEGKSIAGNILPEEYFIYYNMIDDKENINGIEVDSVNYDKILKEWTEYCNTYPIHYGL